MRAVVQIRGEVNMSRGVRDTLEMLNLGRVNHCTLVPDRETYDGMVKKVAEFVAFGEPSVETVATLLQTRGEPADGDEPVDDAWVGEHTAFDDVESLAAALIDEEVTLGDVGLSPTLRLHPPRGGHDGIKHSRRNGGVIGQHDQVEIDELLYSMR